jgi:hypothetical protein
MSRLRKGGVQSAAWKPRVAAPASGKGGHSLNSISFEHRPLLGDEGAVGAAIVVGLPCRSPGPGLRPRWRRRRPCSIPAACIFLVMAWAKVGPAPEPVASLVPRPGHPARTGLLKKPQRSASAPPMARPVASSSAARPWPMMRGSMLHRPPCRSRRGRRARTGRRLRARACPRAGRTPWRARRPPRRRCRRWRRPRWSAGRRASPSRDRPSCG